MDDTTVEMKEVCRSFGQVHALQDFSLQARKGKVVALLGPNGAGKTTCMRILMGLLHPDRGTASVLGQDTWSMPSAERRRIGYLSEGGFAWPKMRFETAVEFVSSFFPSWSGSYVDKLVDLLGVPLGTSFEKMSRGQARKATLALTLGPRPELLILDDPGSGLDPSARREMISGIAGLLRETEATVLVSSHIMTDVERLADEVCFIVNGRPVLHATLEDIKNRSRSILVRGRDVQVDAVARLPNVVRARREGEVVAVTVLGYTEGWIEHLRGSSGAPFDGIQESPIGLEDLYIDLVHAAESGWEAHLP
jgi:ABC-2 type transport system ATP-binding protein